MASIAWVIYGGESGRNARPCNLDWIRNGVRQCQEAKVATFVKQLGALAMYGSIPNETPEYRWLTKDRKGGRIEEFPKDLQVREYPDA